VVAFLCLRFGLALGRSIVGGLRDFLH
jgi:hypothetical protein